MVMLHLLSCLLAAPQGQTFAVDGINIRYYVEGHGEPVVLIHGLHSSAKLNWMGPGIFADLARDHQVIALDLPGHGQSDKPADEKAYGVQVVKDVVALLDHLKIRQAHIVGYSLGGMIAVKMMAMYPDRVISATVGGMGWLREGSRLQQTWERMPGRGTSRTPPEFIHSMGKLAVTEAELKAIKIPTEVIVGQRDPVLRLYVTPLRAARPDWPVVEIENAGHISCVMKPEFREAVGKWVRKQTKE
ncbi:MAG TPA: alpha/beta fold hydrolase [Pirellulales bacterium]|jgi:pimeloyl-ACP methyl ester carboxylesterase